MHQIFVWFCNLLSNEPLYFGAKINENPFNILSVWYIILIEFHEIFNVVYQFVPIHEWSEWKLGSKYY